MYTAIYVDVDSKMNNASMSQQALVAKKGS